MRSKLFARSIALCFGTFYFRLLKLLQRLFRRVNELDFFRRLVLCVDSQLRDSRVFEFQGILDFWRYILLLLRWTFEFLLHVQLVQPTAFLSQ